MLIGGKSNRKGILSKWQVKLLTWKNPIYALNLVDIWQLYPTSLCQRTHWHWQIRGGDGFCLWLLFLTADILLCSLDTVPARTASKEALVMNDWSLHSGISHSPSCASSLWNRCSLFSSAVSAYMQTSVLIASLEKPQWFLINTYVFLLLVISSH